MGDGSLLIRLGNEDKKSVLMLVRRTDDPVMLLSKSSVKDSLGVPRYECLVRGDGGPLDE